MPSKYLDLCDTCKHCDIQVVKREIYTLKGYPTGRYKEVRQKYCIAKHRYVRKIVVSCSDYADTTLDEWLQATPSRNG